MRPTDILMNEHRVIEQVLHCLERIVEESERTGRLDKASATDAVAFFRGFADRCHHGKEEAQLFPMMEARGFPRNGGPTGVMLAEHEQGRLCVRGMDAQIESASGGDAAAIARFGQHARAFIAMLRDHIRKEDECLFAMANHALSEADQQTLLEAFERVEAEEMGLGTHERFLRVADDLAARYGVPKAQLRTCEGQSGFACHHGTH